MLTERTARYFDSDEKWQARRKHIPKGRLGRPEEIAALVCFLLSDEAGWQTGGVYRADGGISAAYLVDDSKGGSETPNGPTRLPHHCRYARASRPLEGWDGLRVGLVPTMGRCMPDICRWSAKSRPIATASLPLFSSIRRNLRRMKTSALIRAMKRRIWRHCRRPKPIVCSRRKCPEMYPDGFTTAITLDGPALGLETDNRPHFFGGVALIVNKLLSQSQTDVAIFGEKDYQQLLVIRRMVRDLDLPVEILSGPIIREADGLAMSSRNVYLNDAHRPIAAKLNGILKALAESKAESQDSREAAEAQAHDALLQAGFTSVDYATIRDAETLAVPTAATTSRRALIVARLGEVRLLDNMAAALKQPHFDEFVEHPFGHIIINFNIARRINRSVLRR